MFSTELLSRLETAQHVAVFTGAGMSAESGVPTFRGEEGIWKKFKPEELANFDAFMKNPALVWEWYNHRKHLLTSLEPNAGHFALAKMEKQHKYFSIATQNVDNLHRRAGSTTIYELHGNIERNYCTGCGKYFSDKEIEFHHDIPHCTSCGSLIRPDVVWFGELLPEEEWNKSVSAAQSSDVYFTIGTSSVVYPAASLPLLAKKAGAFVVEINIALTEFSPRADEVILGKCGELLPRLIEAYHTQQSHNIT